MRRGVQGSGKRPRSPRITRRAAVGHGADDPAAGTDRAHRAVPAHVDVTYDAPLPAACPGCGGAVPLERVAPQSQEDLPVVRPIVRRVDVQVGCCVACRRVQGRHPLQTSDALGAANVHLGPGAVTLIVRLHKDVGVSLEKIATLLRERFGLTVTPGGLVQARHRAARVVGPTYAALCAQIRGSPVVSPDETGWRVDAVLHWLWAFATRRTRRCIRFAQDEASTTPPPSWARTSPFAPRSSTAKSVAGIARAGARTPSRFLPVLSAPPGNATSTSTSSSPHFCKRPIVPPVFQDLPR